MVDDPTLNVAFWNLHERRLDRAGEHFVIYGSPLKHFHFSGFGPRNPDLLTTYQLVYTQPMRVRMGSYPPLVQSFGEIDQDAGDRQVAVRRAALGKNVVMADSPGRRRVLVTGGSGFIGSHLIDALSGRTSVDVVNFDIASPKMRTQLPQWVGGDVRDAQCVRDVFSEFQPTHVVHLAARIDMGGASVADYSVNTGGTSNIVDAIANTKSLERALFISSQFVCQPGYIPLGDDDYRPHTTYGESKAIAEQIVRKAALQPQWVILRPTTVWGPGDIGYRRDFYRTIRSGTYLHPRGKSCLRSYGFVGNVVNQIDFFIDADADFVDRETFYLGDAVADVVDFAREFSRQLRGRDAHLVPAPLVRGIALLGDLAIRIGIDFPLTTSRYRSMTEDYPVPIERTIALTGAGPYSLQEGVQETVAWLQAYEKTEADHG